MVGPSLHSQLSLKLGLAAREQQRHQKEVGKWAARAERSEQHGGVDWAADWSESGGLRWSLAGHDVEKKCDEEENTILLSNIYIYKYSCFNKK